MGSSGEWKQGFSGFALFDLGGFLVGGVRARTLSWANSSPFLTREWEPSSGVNSFGCKGTACSCSTGVRAAHPCFLAASSHSILAAPFTAVASLGCACALLLGS